ncbi:MAG: MBL fold metallo-hydrolase [Candidatus Methanofastidiosia archaeon]|jgi:Cft2 family RNA processing exonuclease
MKCKTTYFQLNRANAWPYRMQLTGHGTAYNEQEEGNTAGYLYTQFDEPFGILIDSGLGTIRKLANIALTLPERRIRLDAILITHAAHDHIAELPILTRSLIASNVYEPREIKVYCSHDTLDMLVERFTYEVTHGLFQLIPVNPLESVDLFKRRIRVTPIDSSRHFKGGCIWVIELKDLATKICAAWDFPPWVNEPGVPQNLSHEKERELLDNIDLFLCDCNTVFERPKTRHNSVVELVKFIEYMKQKGLTPPKEVWPVHYSGREDAQVGPKEYQGIEINGPILEEQRQKFFKSLGWEYTLKEKEF